MIGALVGDVIGSRFEFNNFKSKEFELITDESRFTDDSVLTLAIAKYFLDNGKKLDSLKLIKYIKNFAKTYANAGFGPSFLRRVNSENVLPYNSYGNGAPMRVSSVSYVANSLEEVKKLSYFVTSITHNHPEAIKGAEALSSSIYMLLNGATKSDIKEFIKGNYYLLDYSYEDLVKNYKFDVSTQNSLPEAFYIFLISENLIDAIRTSVSIGGDTDTVGDMVMSLAFPYYLNPKNKEGYKVTLSLSEDKKDEIKKVIIGVLNKFPKELIEICMVFEERYDKYLDKNYIKISD